MSDARAAGEVNARIVYWGVEGAGKRTNLAVIHAKLRPDHRGELREVPTRLDPSVHYAMLPIELGEVSGVRTRIQVFTAPAGAEQAPTRKQLLDRVDGVVFVADARRDYLSENLASFEELRGALAAYGRPLDQVPLVIQYNKRDLSDPYALEELHRKLGLRGVAAFEAIAREGNAVLQTLTTISKRVIRHRREHAEREPTDAAPPEPQAAALETTQLDLPRNDAEVLAGRVEHEAETSGTRATAIFEPSLREETQPPDVEEIPGGSGSELMEFEGVGQGSLAGPRCLHLPLRVRDASGQSREITLRIQIDAIEEPAR